MKDHIYITVLTNVSEGTAVQAKAEKIVVDFLKHINRQAIRTEEQWIKHAYAQFHFLLGEEIAKLQELQKQAVKAII